MDERKSLADANDSVESSKLEDNKTDGPEESKAEERLEKKEEKLEEREEKLQKEEKQIKKEEKTIQKEEQTLKNEEKTRRENQTLHKNKHKLIDLKNKIKGFSLTAIKNKLGHYKYEYSRVLHLARKPTKSEYRELAIMVLVGTGIIGGIGFLIQLLLQFI